MVLVCYIFIKFFYISIEMDRYKILCEFGFATRDLIKHEGILLSNRVNWLFATQAGLFIVLNEWFQKDLIISLIICFIGAIFGVSTYIGVNMAIETQKSLEKTWVKKCRDYSASREGYALSSEDFPPIVGRPATKPLWRQEKLVPWLFLPIVFTIAWLGIAIVLITYNITGYYPVVYK